MKSLYESIMQFRHARLKIDESILDTDKGVFRKTVAEIFVSKIRNAINAYTSGHRGADLQQSLEELWKEYDLEIPEMVWYCTRYDGLKYGTEKGLCIPVVKLYTDGNNVYIAVRSRYGIDYDIKDLNLPQWEKVAKTETRKLTDSFLNRYSKKLDKILDIASEDENEYNLRIYELR